MSLCAPSSLLAWGTPPTTAPSSSIEIDPHKIDAALANLHAKQTEGAAAAPATQPAADAADYSKESLVTRKIELVRHYDQDIASARQALRRHDLAPADVHDLVAEQSMLQQMPIDKFHDLLVELDAKNTRRVQRYHESFGQLETAAATVVTVLMKTGLVDSAAAIADDPLSQDIEESHGVRRVYFRFTLPSHDSTNALRRSNGYIEFQLPAGEGLWLPTWADLQGEPIPLFDLEAFVPLRPFRILYNNGTFAVAQESALNAPPPALFSLLSLHSENERRARGYGPIGAPVGSR